MLGAAGNVARNVAGLGGEALLVGVAGRDAAADEVRALIAAEPSLQDRLVADPARPTTVKTRFVAAGQQLLRLDQEEAAALAAAARDALAKSRRAAA